LATKMMMMEATAQATAPHCIQMCSLNHPGLMVSLCGLVGEGGAG
jgi:hypothetical protein